jgi:hypothetical protein
MNLFFLFVAPAIFIVGILTALSYKFLRRPSPLPLGSIFPLVCAVIWDEIHNHCEYIEQASTARNHLQRQVRSNQASVSRKYVGEMVLNTKLFLQVLRFEKKKIDPHKSSLQYETWETLTLRMIDEASSLHWFLLKARVGLTLRSWMGVRVSRQAMDKMLHEYKQLEQDFVALVRASDEVYYTMLVERLGLSNWRLIDGGSS